MPSFFDASCRKCGKRIGWTGSALDMPDCPRCGTKPDRSSLQKDHDEMQRFQASLPRTAAESTPIEIKQKRIDAGLPLAWAIKKSGIPYGDFKAIESGDRPPTAEETAILDQLYNGGE